MPGGGWPASASISTSGRAQGGRARPRLQPRETRHTFVSIASDSGASIEDIADAAGHVNANVTRAVYRHQISDTVTRAPAAIDQALAAGGEA